MYSIIILRDPERRRVQLSIRLANGRALCDRLSADGVFGDGREPDTYRVRLFLYTTHFETFTGLCNASRWLFRNEITPPWSWDGWLLR